jgi:hypothetical protein
MIIHDNVTLRNILWSIMMRSFQLLGVLLLTMPVFATPGKSLDGVWCSRGEKSLIQFEYKDSAHELLKEQFCILLKTTRTIDDVSVGRVISRYKRVEDYPLRVANYVVKDMIFDAALFAYANDSGRKRLVIVDATDRTTFDLTLKEENLLQGFVQEVGLMSKTKTRNAFAGYVRFDRTGDLPDDFDSKWVEYDESTHQTIVKS